METIDPPCDFDVFVAQRREISDDEARQLIRNWVARYVPRGNAANCSPAFANTQELRHA